MSLTEYEANFAMDVHTLLLCFQSGGIGLVRLPEPHSVPNIDIVEDLRGVVEHFARVKGLSENGRDLLHRHLIDHLYEASADGFGLVSIESTHFTRVR